MADQLIPFGKYKNQPVAILANDKSYCDWLMGQDWMQARYPEIRTLIINNFGEPDETPEHNALQLKFFDEGLRAKVTYAVVRTLPRQQDATWHLATVSEPSFEVQGIDVSWTAQRWHVAWEEAWHEMRYVDNPEYLIPYRAYQEQYRLDDIAYHEAKRTAEMVARQQMEEARRAPWSPSRPPSFCAVPSVAVPQPWDKEFYIRSRALYAQLPPQRYEYSHIMGLRGYAWQLSGPYHDEGLWMVVECKPALGDDYPAVLRTLLTRRNMTSSVLTGYNGTVARLVVVCERFTAQGGTFEQVQRLFAASQCHLFLLQDLEAMPDVTLFPTHPILPGGMDATQTDDMHVLRGYDKDDGIAAPF